MFWNGVKRIARYIWGNKRSRGDEELRGEGMEVERVGLWW